MLTPEAIERMQRLVRHDPLGAELAVSLHEHARDLRDAAKRVARIGKPPHDSEQSWINAFERAALAESRLAEMTKDRNNWKQRAVRAEAEAMTLRDIEKSRVKIDQERAREEADE